MFQRVSIWVASCVAVAFLYSPTNAQAVTFNVAGVNNPLNTALVDFIYDGIDKLTIEIKNTSTSGPDPRITGFVFNAPSAVSGISLFSASGTADDSDWDDSFDRDKINTPGSFGEFDIAGITGPNLNGGTPNSGIVKNTAATFMFSLLGTGLDLLDEGSFLNLFSSGKGNFIQQAFGIRFQRTDLDKQGSDIGFVTTVPLPAALPLMGAGFAVLGFVGWRRKRKAA